MNPRPPSRLVCVIALLLLVLAAVGCASVTVRKVPTPTQYIEWTDSMQRRADRMEGLRYYLPRPFLNVFESFPVRTDIYLANGVITPDNQGVLIRDLRPDSSLSDFFASGTNQVTVPKTVIASPGDNAGGARAQSDPLPPSTGASPSDSVIVGVQPGASAASRGGSAAARDDAPASAPVTGQNRRDVRNDNGAYAYQPMRGHMDIAYLPDFEEQYTVSSRAGLGNAQFALNLGQGWSLQGLNSLADNQELNKRIFDIIDSSIEMAKAAAKASMGIPPIPDGGLDKVISAKPQRAPAELDDQPPGTPVTLKIVVVHYAAKGLYPVIKPRELQERLRSDSRTNRFLYLNLHKMLGQVPDPVSAFDPKAITAAQKMIENETRNFTVPRYPYQYVGFQTFRYMAIEIVRPGAKPFETLYDKTGTQGPAGAANESAARPSTGSRLSAGVTRRSAALTQNQVNAWTGKLKSISRIESLHDAEASGDYKINNATYDIAQRHLTVDLTLTGEPVWVSSNRLSEVVRQLADTTYKETMQSTVGVPAQDAPVDRLTLVFDERMAAYLKAQGNMTHRVARALKDYRRTSGANGFVKVELGAVVAEEPLSVDIKALSEGTIEPVLTKDELEREVALRLQQKLELGSAVKVRVVNAEDARLARILK